VRQLHGKDQHHFSDLRLWTLYNFPTARLMNMRATYDQVVNQFFSGLSRLATHRYFAGWQWLESEVRTASGGFLFGRASDVGGHIEGIHDQAGSVAGLLIDEAKRFGAKLITGQRRASLTSTRIWRRNGGRG
jgi:hypothetical protein